MWTLGERPDHRTLAALGRKARSGEHDLEAADDVAQKMSDEVSGEGEVVDFAESPSVLDDRPRQTPASRGVARE